MEFGPVLRQMRKSRGYSQEKMAELMHMCRSNITKIELDMIDLKAKDLIRWCKITKHPEVMMAFIYGADVAQVLSAASQVITGTILRIGGFL